jgi:hypothetical protein
MVVVTWRLGAEEWSAKVVPLARADADVDQPDHTAEVRSRENVGGIEKDTGAQKRAELADGAGVLLLGRLPRAGGVRVASVHVVSGSG